MKQRELKFRAWDEKSKTMFDGATLQQIRDALTTPGEVANTQLVMYQVTFKDHIHLQYTGAKVNGVEVYEGDIMRVEEPEDGHDRRYWLVCTWVEEWGMWAWLNITSNEYADYLELGIKALDENRTMLFSFIVVNDDDKKVGICGNMYQHPEYLDPNYNPVTKGKIV